MTARLLGGIDHVCIGASDLEATTRFFVEGLGLWLLADGLIGGSGYLALWGTALRQPRRARLIGHPGAPGGRLRIVEAALPPPPSTTLIDLGIFDVDFMTTDLDALCRRIRHVGFPLWTDPRAYQVGTIEIREVVAEAPDGLRSALIQDTGSPSALRAWPELGVSEATITAVGVDDLERGLTFYRAAFGLAPMRVFEICNRDLNAVLRIPASVTLRVGLLDMAPARLELIQVIDGGEPRQDIREQQRPPRAGFQGNAYRVAALDEALAACLAAGATLLAGPVDLPADILHPASRRAALLADPVGTAFELMEERG